MLFNLISFIYFILEYIIYCCVVFVFEFCYLIYLQNLCDTNHKMTAVSVFRYLFCCSRVPLTCKEMECCCWLAKNYMLVSDDKEV